MPLITLTSDIGETDYLAGAMKGVLMGLDESFRIIDITHGLSAFNYPQAAYVCRSAIRNFPKGTLHLIMVDMFDDKPDQLLIAEHEGQYIGCPDNGLITMILESTPEKIIALPVTNSAPRNLLTCIEVFGKAFSKISSGTNFKAAGELIEDIKVKNPLRPMLGPDWIDGQIIFIDRFENVVVNIHRDEFEAQKGDRQFSIVFKRDEVIDKISETYADVAVGEKLALFNSAGYLEIAINKGNAAGLFGLQGFSEKYSTGSQINSHRLFYQTVKVYFQ